MSTWIADPATGEPMAAIPSKERELSYRQKHWRPGWLSGFDRVDGVPVRMWFRLCPDPCCEAVHSAELAAIAAKDATR